MASGLFNLAKTVVTLMFGMLPWLWAKTGTLMPFVAGNEIRHTIAFVLLLSAVEMLFSLPWSVISTFYLEAKHGFNKQTPALFVGERCVDRGRARGLRVCMLCAGSGPDSQHWRSWQHADVRPQQHSHHALLLSPPFCVSAVDTLKGIALGVVLLPPIVGAFTYILLHSGPYMPLYLWLFMLVLGLVMMTIYPTLIAPIFNKARAQQLPIRRAA